MTTGKKKSLPEKVYNNRRLAPVIYRDTEEQHMQINLSGHHVDLTPAIKSYINSKLDRLEKHHDRITSTNVILSVDKLRQKAEASIHVSGKDFFADSESENLYAAIDLLTDKLDRQLIKYKEKIRNHR